jgi:glutamate carboxypeptidase
MTSAEPVPTSTADPRNDPGSLDLRALRDRVAGYYDEYVADLETMVNVDCGSYTPDGVNHIADLMQARLERTGWVVDRRPHVPGPGAPRFGDTLVARLVGARPSSEGGLRVLLVAHMDTVFPEGTAAARPFRVEGSRALGPGVSDMKDGLLAGWFAVRALQDAGALDVDSVTYVCNPDEEVGSPWSSSIIEEVGVGMDVAFVLEGARENGDLVSARKGIVDLRLVIHGRAAHAGVEPERGRSAILQAAHTTLALHALNGRWPGVTVNVGVIDGGSRPNVVADRCELRVDVRATTNATFEEALREIERVVERIDVPDTRVEASWETGFPPMEKTPATARLVERAQDLARELGFEVQDASTGGASDANRVARMGVPVLDGLGPIGGDDHSVSEWVDLESVVPRTTLLAAMIAAPFPNGAPA